MPVEINHFTDPACPFAFSAEPIRQRRQPRSGGETRAAPEDVREVLEWADEPLAPPRWLR